MVVLDNSIIQDFEQICSTFLKIFKLYLLDTPTFIIEPFYFVIVTVFAASSHSTDAPSCSEMNLIGV